MTTLKPVVRKQRADGFYAVYIRIVHLSRMGYIKTDKVIRPKNITAKGDFNDPVVNEYSSIDFKPVKVCQNASEFCNSDALYITG